MENIMENIWLHPINLPTMHRIQYSRETSARDAKVFKIQGFRILLNNNKLLFLWRSKIIVPCPPKPLALIDG